MEQEKKTKWIDTVETRYDIDMHGNRYSYEVHVSYTEDSYDWADDD
jgi:hypothetical protein